jgi:hypothetical protein
VLKESAQLPKNNSWLVCIIYSPIFWVMLTVLAYRGVYDHYLYPKPLYWSGGDTQCYFDASEDFFKKLIHVELRQSYADRSRSPGYPCLIAIVRDCFSQTDPYAWLIFIQRVVSLIAVYFFYRTAHILLKNRGVVIVITLYFACLPAILAHDSILMTESLSISGSVFIVFLLVSHSHSPTYFRAICIGIMTFFLVMLRSNFLVLILIIPFFFIIQLYRQKKHWSKEMVGITVFLLSFTLIIFYGNLFKKRYGFFDLSTARTHNQFCILIQSGLYRHGSNLRINEEIQSGIDKYEKNNPNRVKVYDWTFPTGLGRAGFKAGVGPLFTNSPAEIADYTSQTIKKNQWRFFRYNLGKFFGVMPLKFGGSVPIGGETISSGSLFVRTGSYNSQAGVYVNLMFRTLQWFITFQFVYVLLIIDFVLFCIVWYYSRKISLEWFCIWLFMTGIIIAGIIGAPQGYERFSVPALPLTMLLIAKFCDLLVYLWRNICGHITIQYLVQ